MSCLQNPSRPIGREVSHTAGQSSGLVICAGFTNPVGSWLLHLEALVRPSSSVSLRFGFVIDHFLIERKHLTT